MGRNPALHLHTILSVAFAFAFAFGVLEILGRVIELPQTVASVWAGSGEACDPRGDFLQRNRHIVASWVAPVELA